MHSNEQFVKNATQEELLELVIQAELKGPQYVAAFKEQLERLGVTMK